MAKRHRIRFALIPDYQLDAFYEDPPASEVEFGEFAGQNKWERLNTS